MKDPGVQGGMDSEEPASSPARDRLLFPKDTKFVNKQMNQFLHLVFHLFLVLSMLCLQCISLLPAQDVAGV